jgi:hypothetical protein
MRNPSIRHAPDGRHRRQGRRGDGKAGAMDRAARRREKNTARFDGGGNLGYGWPMKDDDRQMLREIIEHCRAEADRRERRRSAEDAARKRAYGRVMRAARELLEEDA